MMNDDKIPNNLILLCLPHLLLLTHSAPITMGTGVSKQQIGERVKATKKKLAETVVSSLYTKDKKYTEKIKNYIDLKKDLLDP